jgi:hypothetical protein
MFGRELGGVERILNIIEPVTAGRYSGKRLRGTPEEQRRLQIILMYLAKGEKTLLAILANFREGFEQDAEMLLRTLLEAAVNLSWVAVEPNVRFERWRAFAGMRWMELFEVAKRHYPEDVQAIPGENVAAARAGNTAYCNRSRYSPALCHFAVRDDLEVFPQRCVTHRSVMARRTV